MPAPRLTDRLCAVEAAVDLLQRAAHVGGGDPVLRGVSVDDQLQRLAVADRDRGAVVDGLVDGRRDLVVGAQADALVLQHVTDRVTGGSHVLDLAVDVECHVLPHRGVPDGGSDHGGQGDRRGHHEGGLALAQVCELLAHCSPDVVLPGPRGRAARGGPSPAGAGHDKGCATGTQPRRRSRMTHPIPANSHETLRGSVATPPTRAPRCDEALPVRKPPVDARSREHGRLTTDRRRPPRCSRRPPRTAPSGRRRAPRPWPAP